MFLIMIILILSDDVVLDGEPIKPSEGTGSKYHLPTLFKFRYDVFLQSKLRLFAWIQTDVYRYGVTLLL